MIAAQLQTLDRIPPIEQLRAHFVEARFEALTEWDITLADARAIAEDVTVDIVEAVGLLRQGCPAPLVVPILAA